MPEHQPTPPDYRGKPGYVDQGAQPHGEHARWAEICRLRNLLREAVDLIDQLDCLAIAADYPALHAKALRWTERALRELA